MTFREDKIPACACSGHPTGEDRRKYMFVAEEKTDYVVWCCQRCSEIIHEPVIQVRITPRGKQQAHYLNQQQNPQMDEQKRRIIQQLRAMRGKSPIRYEEMNQ